MNAGRVAASLLHGVCTGSPGYAAAFDQLWRVIHECAATRRRFNRWLRAPFGIVCGWRR
jgi:hypothetical protein